MKKIVFGILIGILLTSTVVYGASAIKEAYFNSAVLLKVDGKLINTEILTVTKEGQVNGKNYVSARDLAEALGAAVTWANNTISVSTNATTTAAVPVQQLAPVTAPVQSASVSLNDIKVCDVNGVKGVPLETLQKYLNGKRCWLAKNEDGSYRLVEITETTKLLIRSFMDGSTEYIKYEDYEKRILPRLPYIDKYKDTPDFKTPTN